MSPRFYLKILVAFTCLGTAAFLTSCSESSFSGNSKQPAKLPNNNNATPRITQPQMTPGQDDVSTPPSGGGDVVTPSKPIGPNIPPPSGTFIPPITPPATPPTIVDNTEVINDCSACKQRANQLASSAGFTINNNSTYSLGPYKVDPSLGVCDIHFLEHDNLPISPHDPTDGIGERQVFLYCPCDCGWKSYRGFY